MDMEVAALRITNIMLTGSDDKTASNEAHFSTAQTA
jgi:hypothetical protein